MLYKAELGAPAGLAYDIGFNKFGLRLRLEVDSVNLWADNETDSGHWI